MNRSWRFCAGICVAMVVFMSALPVAFAQMSFEANALFLDRVNNDQKVLSQMVGAPAPPPDEATAVLFTDSVEFDFEAGVEVKLSMPLDSATILEGVYLGLQRFSESASKTDLTNQLNAPFSVGNGTTDLQVVDDFFGAQTQGFSFTSQIHSAELNVRRRLTDPLSFLCGVRYIEYDERINFFSLDGPQAPAGVQRVGQYDVDTDNHMLGIQVGGDANYVLSDSVAISCSLRSAMFINWVASDTLLLNNAGGFILTSNGLDIGLANREQGGADDTSLASLIDASLKLDYSLGNLQIHCGYRVLIMGGMALAADQYDFSINEDPAAVIGNVNHQGTLVLHGPFAGLVYTL